MRITQQVDCIVMNDCDDMLGTLCRLREFTKKVVIDWPMVAIVRINFLQRFVHVRDAWHIKI